MTKKAFKNALVKMLADGEFDKLVDAYPAKAGWILSLKASLAELEENHDGGIREFPIMGLIGGFIDEEPVLSDVLTYMLTEANRADVEQGAVPMTEENMAEHGWVRERTCRVVKNSRKYVLSDGTELFDDGCSICNGYIGAGENCCSNCGAKVVE